MRYVAFAILALITCAAMAQPAQQPDHTAQAAYATANDLMTALIATRAGVLDGERKLGECRAELAKAKEPAAPK